MSNLKAHGINTQLLSEETISFIDSKTGPIGDALCRTIDRDIDTYTRLISVRDPGQYSGLVEELNNNAEAHFNNLVLKGYQS